MAIGLVVPRVKDTSVAAISARKSNHFDVNCNSNDAQ